MNCCRAKTKTVTLNAVCVVTGLIVAMLVISCAASKRQVKRPEIKVHSMELAKAVENIGETGVPVNPTSVFSSEDKQVVALIKFDNISGSYQMRWDWFNPDHKLHCSSGNMPVNISKGKFIRTMTAWHALDLEADKALKLTGQWYVKFYVNNELVDSKPFQLVNGRDAGLWPQAGSKSGRRFENHWGLVIGIQEYPNLPMAKCVRQDVAKVKDWLTRTLYVPEDHVVTLLDNNATKVRIQNFIKYFLSENVKANSVLYVYYAGHGWINSKSGKPILLPFETTPERVDADGYRLEELIQDLESLNTFRTYLFLETSFNGGKPGSAGLLKAAAGEDRRKLNKYFPLSLRLDVGHLMVVGAAADDQNNNVNEEKQESMFTYHLTRSLDAKLRPELKKQKVNIGDMFMYVAENVKKDSGGNRQTPWIAPSLDKIGKLLMFQKDL